MPDIDRWSLDRAVYAPGQHAGHYESFYLRANHPQRPLAFWIRYTIFAPAGRPDDAVGELWAVAFDSETGRHAQLTVRDRRSGTSETLRAGNRALFEILTSDDDHGIAIRA